MSVLPIVPLPRTMPARPERPVQANIPPTRAERDAVVTAARRRVADGIDLVPPLPLDELRDAAEIFCREEGFDLEYVEFVALLINNELWRETLAAIPYERRLLLLPKCLRIEEHCPAPFDELGLLCKKCGLCSIQDLQEEAERMGYPVLVAEGSPIVMALLQTGKIDAIVGVSCLHVLEKVYSYMEAAAVPGLALPLLQDDCIDTNVDLDWVWDAVHLTSDDHTRRLDLGGLRDDVRSWFDAEPLDALLGETGTATERLGREWLASGGKRWRPFLTVAVRQALSDEPGGAISDDLKRVAVAVECFHKASLIHDDLEDGDLERDGRPTLHAVHGEAVALNVGDYLLGEGYRLLAESEAPAAHKVEMLRLAADGHRTLCLGQGEELVWQRDPKPLKAVEVVEIFRRKTAPAFEIALRLGAAHAGADEGLHDALNAYSESLGIAYQIRDDLDDLAAAAANDQAPERRPTLPWALAHEMAKRARKPEVRAAWLGEGDSEVSAIDAHTLLHELGVHQRSQELLEAYKEEAIKHLRRLDDANVKGLLRRVLGKIFDDLQIEGWCREHEARNAAGG
ncbi:MAG: polyprenyl synthetase family protein [Acidobacteriota bacterium]